jgi:SAM-dependent methyltransferase
MGLPADSVGLGTESTAAEVPTFDDVVAKLPDFVTVGESFSQEMAQWCNTSKFLSYTMRKDSCGYQDIYAQILKNLRGRDIRILEIGIGVNDPTAKSGMSENHRPGASLNGWCGYFPGAEVHGADVDRRCLVDSDQYKTHFADQLDVGSLQSLAIELGGEFDLVVDDGLHTPEANANVIAAFLPLLKPHGILVVEDILAEFDALWFAAPAYLPKGYRLDFFPSSVLRQFRGFRAQVGMAVITRG